MSSDATSSFDRSVLAAIHGGERLVRAWKTLSAKRRLAAYAAFGLFVGLFLPWYSQTVVAGRPAQPRSVSLNGFDAFSLVPTVVLLVSIGVLVLLYERGNGRRFRLPGGDGGAILAVGCITFVLIVIGMFDRPGASGPGLVTTATGVEWGIFIVLALSALLAYAGSQIRLAPYREPQTRTRGGSASPPPSTRHGDDATRVAKRPPYDQPTPASNPRTAVDTPTRVSTRRRPRPGADDTKESPTRIGPQVVPEDPPTVQLRRTKPPKPFRAEEPQPPDGWSTNEK
jgi:hypothetical protein